jgi:hypothetical protein
MNINDNRSANNNNILHNVLPHQRECIGQMCERQTDKTEQWNEGAGKMKEQKRKDKPIPDSKNNNDTKNRFPQREKDDRNFIRNKSKGQKVNGVFRQLIRRTQLRKKFQGAKPDINNSDADAEKGNGM